MSEAAAAEPTMEEILASIRRIISEDETPAAEAAPEVPEEEKAPPAPAPVAAAPEPEPAPPPPAKEEVLELTQRVEAPSSVAPPPPPASSMGDLDFSDADVAPAAPAPAPKIESLVSDYAATAAAGHFGALGQALLMPSAGRTLEDVVKELMKPMLKAWLDENLPLITEAAVRSEVERISRRGH